MLRPLKVLLEDNASGSVLKGLASVDDAAVYRLRDGNVAVLTIDFFPPVVDGARDYGAIAAANSMSDVWAMGADPVMALNVAMFPPDMPVEVREDILVAAAEKVLEAGAVIAGGHTMDQKDPVFGLVVMGIAGEDRLMSKTGITPGNDLVLTKPLGSGVVTTAAKAEKAPGHAIRAAIATMTSLNNKASEIARKHDVRCATDVTGFGLLGHCLEMCEGSGTGMEIRFSDIRFIDGAKELASQWLFPGGAYGNKNASKDKIAIDPSIPEHEAMLLFDPQTSGGLLLQVNPSKTEELLSEMERAGIKAACIGTTTDKPSVTVVPR